MSSKNLTKKKKKVTRPTRNNQVMRKQGPEFPPPYNTANLQNGKMRFRFFESTAASTSYSISPAQLGALVAVGLTATTASGIFETVRVHSVSVWAPTGNAAASTPSEVAVIFPSIVGGSIGPQRVWSDYSMGMTHNAHVRAVPEDQAAQWQNTNVNNALAQQVLFSIHTPPTVQCVIDVVMEWKCAGTLRPLVAATVTLGVSSVGVLYYLALDNPAGGSGGTSVLVPDQVLNTTS